jgi:protein gp37
MGLHSDISWTDSTVSPTTGCEGCELWSPRRRSCYAGQFHEKRLAKAMPQLYDADFQNVRLVPGRMMKAAAWPDLTGKPRPERPWMDGLPRFIFVGHMADFASKQVPTSYIVEEIIGAIKSQAGSRHFWLLLTKQIERLAKISLQIGGLPDNCMAMTTITDQRTANKRLPWLLLVECRYRGISAEPLLGGIDLSTVITEQNETRRLGLDLIRGEDFVENFTRHGSWGARRVWRNAFLRRLDWLITGGESGEDYRAMDLDHARSLHDQCRAAGAPVFYKQDSGPRAGMNDRLDGERLHEMPRI